MTRVRPMRSLHRAPVPPPPAAEQPAEAPGTSAAPPAHSPSRPLPGSVAKLACMFEGQQQPAARCSPASASAAAAARTKRQRLGMGGPPLPEEWLQSPPLANGGKGAAEGLAPVERELFEGEGDEQAAACGEAAGTDAAAAREARLRAIRAK